MNLSPDAYGVIKKIDENTEVAYAISKDGQTMEFKFKMKAKQIQAQDIIDMCGNGK